MAAPTTRADDPTSDVATPDVPELGARREQLVALYAGREDLDEATVRARLDAICRRLSGARVRSYLPVLVERGLRESLGRA